MSVITLSWHEVGNAAIVGSRRQMLSLKDGRKDAHGFDGVGWSEHIEGALGEMALAKMLGVYWGVEANRFKLPDVGSLQVRTLSSHGYDLIVRENDADDEYFVLVTGKCPTYWIRGAILGRDAKKPEFLKKYGGREPAYFVPVNALGGVPGGTERCPQERQQLQPQS